MSVIRTGVWAYSIAALSKDSWAIVAQCEADYDGRLMWFWPEWSREERIAFDLAVDQGRILKITGPAAQPPAQYWLYAKLANSVPRMARQPLTLRQAGLTRFRALPEFA